MPPLSRRNMKRFLLLFLLLSNLAYGQAWSGVLASSRAIDWSTTGVSIPTRNTQCGTTIAAYTGTASTINTAIANCAAGQVVLLAAGTFNLSSGITFNNRSNVTLRGAGPNQTFLVFSGRVGCQINNVAICIGGGAPHSADNPGTVAN